MAECDPQTFPAITEAHLQLFLTKAEQFGIQNAAQQGHSGQASHSGFTLRWHYEPSNHQLTVQCLKSPMLVPCSLINGKIREAIASATGTPAAPPTHQA